MNPRMMSDNDLKVWAKDESQYLSKKTIGVFERMTVWQRCLAWVVVLISNRDNTTRWFKGSQKVQSMIQSAIHCWLIDRESNSIGKLVELARS